MYKFVHRLSWLLAVLMLLHSFFFWGGVALHPDVEDSFVLSSVKSMDTIGVGIYAGTGKGMFGFMAPDAARIYAEKQVGHTYPAAAAARYDKAVPVRNALQGFTRFAHFGTPYAFLVALILYWRREKVIPSLGR